MTNDPTIREPLLKMARGWMEAAAAERSQRSRKQSQKKTFLLITFPYKAGLQVAIEADLRSPGFWPPL
jgi:hypothetical protein